MKRDYFEHDELRFSYLENNSLARDGVLVLLHAHWMGASDFEEIIPALSRGWRVIALDQRGHGQTAHGGVHSTDTYVGDIDALLEHLDIKERVVLLGHSFGGMVANLYAAAKPAKMRGLIIEDIDVAREDNDEFMLGWAGHCPSREELEAKIGARLASYLQKSITRDEQGWRLTFDPHEVLASEKALNGDHWPEWLSHRCPALVISGARSPVVRADVLVEMARRRANTEMVKIDAGHSVHIDAPGAFITAVNRFLAALEGSSV